VWFSSVFLLWQAFFLKMITDANQVSPPHLDSIKVVLSTVPLLTFTLGWFILLAARFLKTEKRPRSDVINP